MYDFNIIYTPQTYQFSIIFKMDSYFDTDKVYEIADNAILDHFNCVIEIPLALVDKDDKSKIPAYATEGSAGLDVKAAIKENVQIKPMQRVMIPTGIKVKIPKGFEIQVRARSGLAINHGITVLNGIGTIDSDFTNEIQVILINLSDKVYEVKPNDKIAQIVLNRVRECAFKIVDELKETEHKGFGSSGI
jgi:dUTP pyrophosphatase